MSNCKKVLYCTHLKLSPINAMQGGVCLAFTDEVLCWLYGTVKEGNFFFFFIFQNIKLDEVDVFVNPIFYLIVGEDYILQFMPPFHRLELLRGQSCPDAITRHVELLTQN